MNTDHYKHFCTVISKGPATDCIATIQMVMKLSGGSCDPNLISEWWNQWQMLKQAMKDNHPVVKLKAESMKTAPPVTTIEREQVVFGGRVIDLLTHDELVAKFPQLYVEPDPAHPWNEGPK